MGWGDDLGYFLTKAIAGRAVADRSDQRRLEKKYSHIAEDLKLAKEVTFEQPAPASPSSSARSTSSCLDPLPPRLPPQGTIRRRHRPPLERSQSETCTHHINSQVSHNPTRLSDMVSPHTLASQDSVTKPVKPNEVEPDIWKTGVKFPPMHEMRGLGRYRVGADADEEFQREYLQRTMSDLTGQMVNHLGDFEACGIDPAIWQSYRKSRTESMVSSTSSRCSTTSSTPLEVFDPKRRVSVVRGFTPSLISSSASSAAEDGSSHYGKDSSLSVASNSSDGGSRHRRRKSRQVSIPFSDNSAGSPLDTISETPDGVEKPQQRVKRRSQLGGATNNESAVVSDGSEDEAWMPEIQTPANASLLTDKIVRERKLSGETQQVTMTRTRSSDKSRHPTKQTVDRAKTIKHPIRPAFRRAHSHRRSKGKLKTVEITKAEVSQKQAETAEDEDVKLTPPVTIPTKQASSTRAGSEEGRENPTDLHEYMEKAKRQHSTKTRRKKNPESDDDSASIQSTSTTKTIVQLTTRIAGILPIHGRQRSVTAIKAPAIRCQSANKADGVEPETTQQTAH